MNKEQLMAAYESAISTLSNMEEPDESDWTYPDLQAEFAFLVFCAGVNKGETK